MKKSLVSLIAAAGLVAVGGIAQAQTYVVPSGTTVLVSPATTTTIDTTVLGAGPSTVMVPADSSVHVQPGWSGNYSQRHQAAATFNVPARAGEASTMTGGVPNASTDNQQIAHDIYVPVYSTPN